ncbi:helix-turn-helix domain-containing protein [Lachnospiraceae bacterium 54-53]
MTHYIREYGEVYDALVYLSYYFEKPEIRSAKGIASDISENACYSALNKWVQESNCDIPDYLRTFCHGSAEDIYLYKAAFEHNPYTQCSSERLIQALQNKTFSKRRYVEHFLPHADAGSVRKMLQLEHPASIELLRQAELPGDIETYFLYTLIHFDKIIDTMCQIIEALCKKIACLHKEFLVQNPRVMEAALSISTAEKLKALANGAVSGDLNISISLLSEQRFSICSFEHSSFLLGKDFGEVLNTRYKYAAVTPFNFAQAIGNQTKYDIFQALLEHSPQSTADLCKHLHLSKNSITYNLNEMLTQGILLLDHVKGLSHYYRIDSGYIQSVADMLTQSAMKIIES